jgi:hypothetical protein
LELTQSLVADSYSSLPNLMPIVGFTLELILKLKVETSRETSTEKSFALSRQLMSTPHNQKLSLSSLDALTFFRDISTKTKEVRLHLTLLSPRKRRMDPRS